MRIPNEAVEAAVDALVMTRMGDYNIEMREFRKAAREVLEAAAPHLMAAAWEAGYDGGYGDAQRGYDLAANPYRKPA